MAKRRFAYGMRMRGFSLGCQPMGDLIEALDDPTETFYNILVYGRRLTGDEVKQYELQYLGEVGVYEKPLE